MATRPRYSPYLSSCCRADAFETVELSYRSGLLNRSCSFLYNISFPFPQVWSLAVQGSEMSTGPVSLVSVPSRTTSVRPSPLRVPGELPCLNHLLRVCAYSEITLRFLCQILRLSTDARLSSRLSVFRPSQTRTDHLVNEVVACAIGSTRSGRPNIWRWVSQPLSYAASDLLAL